LKAMQVETTMRRVEKRMRGLRLGLLVGLLAGTGVARAQGYTPPPPRLTTLPPCPADKKLAKQEIKKNQCDPLNVPDKNPPPPAPAQPAAQQFPFPGDAGGAPATPATPPTAQAFPYPGDPVAPAAPTAKPAPAPDAAPPSKPGGGATADQFPYPGDSTPAAPTPAAGQKNTGDPFPYPGDPAPSPAPPAPATGQKGGGATGDPFPYPGDPAAPAQPGPDSSSPSSSSSSSDSSSSSGQDQGDSSDAPPKLNDKGSEGSRSRRVLKVTGEKTQTDDERVDDDLNVAHFYMQSGNAMGAYLRAQDAVKTEPDYAPTHFSLGEAAQRLRKHDEAVAEFKLYLKLAPNGDNARAAAKALAELH